MEWKPEDLRDSPETAEDWHAGSLMTAAEAVDAARRFLVAVPAMAEQRALEGGTD
jgi:hypothetical protein